MTSQPRPVWLTEDEAEHAGYLDRWDAAPADAAEAVTKALTPWTWATYRTQITESALGALGYPRTEQA